MIGILGGTFDPVHLAHLRCALELQQTFDFEEIRFVPCRLPPHRPDPGADPEQRLAMLELALGDQAGFVTDDRELRRPGPSYTVDTLESFRAERQTAPLCMIVGMDAFLQLPTWHRWERLIDLAHLVVMCRPGRELDDAPAVLRGLLDERGVEDPHDLRHSPAGRIALAGVTRLDISATHIRSLVGQGRSIRYLVPDRVLDYIRQERLYLGAPGPSGTAA